MNKYLIRTSALCLTAALGLALNGCSSTSDEDYTADTGSSAYGSGPNNTRPYPQSKQVDIAGVGGAKIVYAPISKRGNKDYKVGGKHYKIWKGCDSYVEEGMASWYGPGFHGNTTSSGERFDQRGYTAAHKNLPLPSYVKVTNLNNNKQVIVKVNDRGPFHSSRIIDLSEGAARTIGLIGSGTGKVRVEYLKVEPGNLVSNAMGQPGTLAPLDGHRPTYDGKQFGSTPEQRISAFYIQLISSKDSSKAKQIATKVRQNLAQNVVINDSGNTYRVMIGPYQSENDARVAQDLAKQHGFPDSFVKSSIN
ncbi:MAG: septal ring lytic transglycosylase RlpA family protein [Succinivibrio sp.]|nr:septal ring lytic transglycosylase RlpA family protein [Succinivibrio sp.]